LVSGSRIASRQAGTPLREAGRTRLRPRCARDYFQKGKDSSVPVRNDIHCGEPWSPAIWFVSTTPNKRQPPALLLLPGSFPVMSKG
jgi:hypothetical protein